MTTINSKAIPEIFQKSPTAEAFATYAACRVRNVRGGTSRLPVIRTQMAKEGFEPVRQDLRSMFRELERAGVGTLKGEYFKWNVPIKTVGLAADVPRAHMAEIPPTEAPKRSYESKTAKAEKNLTVYFESGNEVNITYTGVLTRDEADFICHKLTRAAK